MQKKSSKSQSHNFRHLKNGLATSFLKCRQAGHRSSSPSPWNVILKSHYCGSSFLSEAQLELIFISFLNFFLVELLGRNAIKKKASCNFVFWNSFGSLSTYDQTLSVRVGQVDQVLLLHQFKSATSTAFNAREFQDAATILLNGLDQTYDPCEDFYMFTCKKYVDSVQLGDQPRRGTYDESQEQVNAAIANALDSQKYEQLTSRTEQILWKVL